MAGGSNIVRMEAVGSFFYLFILLLYFKRSGKDCNLLTSYLLLAFYPVLNKTI